jgi:chorismate mutase
MLESTSPSTLEELEQLLKNLNERLKYLEKVVRPRATSNN